MDFSLDSDIYNKNRQTSLAERIGAQQVDTSKASAGVDNEKVKQAKALQYLSMATPENWAATRQQAISEGIGSDQVIPPQFDQKWVDEAKTAFDAALKGSTPAAIQEYNFYQKLGTPQEKQDFRDTQRAQPYLNLGGSFVQPSASGGVRNEINKTVPPQDRPEIRGAQAEAKAEGTAKGTAQGAIDKKIIQAPIIEGYLKQAEALLPGATSGGASTLYRDAAAFAGNATKGSNIDSQLDVIGAALTSGVPRMEGPQSNYDVQLYQKAAGDLANPKKPRETRIAAIKTIREINDRYSQQGGGEQSPGKLIGTSGGKKVFELPDGSHVMEQ